MKVKDVGIYLKYFGKKFQRCYLIKSLYADFSLHTDDKQLLIHMYPELFNSWYFSCIADIEYTVLSKIPK